MNEQLEAVRTSRAKLDDLLDAVDRQRLVLYHDVRDAVRGGIGPTQVAAAARWSTKQAVYNAVARVDAEDRS
jgi:hypothetical protein